MDVDCDNGDDHDSDDDDGDSCPEFKGYETECEENPFEDAID